MPRLLSPLLCSVLLLLATVRVDASAALALDLDALLERSQAVLVARTMGQQAFWSGGRIATRVQLQVEQSEKGECVPGEAIEVLRWGGTVGDVGMRRSGEPSFHDGGRALLFLRRLHTGLYRPVGLAQGALSIEERKGGDWIVPEMDGLMLLHSGAQKGRGRLAAAAFQRPEPLAGVLARIRARLAR